MENEAEKDYLEEYAKWAVKVINHENATLEPVNAAYDRISMFRRFHAARMASEWLTQWRKNSDQ